MARMRTLKPEAFLSLSLADVDRGIRWTFSGLWTVCDDEGRASYDPRLIKAAIYPLDDAITPAVVEADMRELERVHSVCFYTVAGRRYVHVPSWHDHQHPNRKVESKLPPCPKGEHVPDLEISTENSTDVQRSEDSVRTHEQLTPVVVVESRGDVGVDGDVGGADSAKPKRRATRIAEDWQPNLADIEWARGKGYPDAMARHETEKFKNYWGGKSGRDATKDDWSKTWKVWMLKAGEQNGRASPPSAVAPATAKAQGWLTVGTESEPQAIEGARA